MKLSSLMLCVIIPVCAFRAQAGYSAYSGWPTSYHCDFNNGIPDEITLVDNDGNEPSADVASYGFAKGNPWVVVRTDDSHLGSAASTSWYKTAATSDDWMILPRLTVVSKDVTLSWEARAHDNVLSDGYEVYVSESGDSPEDFKKYKPVFSCSAESAEWTRHTVNLADYAGKDVRIAFVNNSSDKALLYIDNIAVEEKKALSSTRFVPALLAAGEKLSLTGRVMNNTAADMKGVSMKFTIDGREYATSDEALIIPANGSAEISMGTDFVSATMSNWPYTLTVSSGQFLLTEEGELLSVRQNVLMEEGTGTWCQFCPKGAVAIERLKARYPDTFIPVAVHVNDPMVLDGYSVYTTSGYPVCVANRIDKLRGNPDNMEAYYQGAAAKDPAAALVSAGIFDRNTGKITLKTKLAFAKEYVDAQFAMQYIVVENNVHGDEAGYWQMNAFSGGDVEMGGFENLPNPVPASQMWYQEVARLRAGDEAGIRGSIPGYIVAGVPVSHDYELILGDNVMNPDQIEVIAAVVDTKTGEIVNSAYAAVDGLSAVKDIDVAGDMRIERTGDALRVVSDSEIERLTLMSIDGRTAAESVNSYTIDISGAGHGVFILRVKAKGVYRSFKQML